MTKEFDNAASRAWMANNDRTITRSDTVKATLKAIRDIGLIATHRDGEYRVTFTREEIRTAAQRESMAYYTNDASDARHTAKRMREARNESILHARQIALRAKLGE